MQLVRMRQTESQTLVRRIQNRDAQLTASQRSTSTWRTKSVFDISAFNVQNSEREAVRQTEIQHSHLYTTAFCALGAEELTFP